MSNWNYNPLMIFMMEISLLGIKKFFRKAKTTNLIRLKFWPALNQEKQKNQLPRKRISAYKLK